MKYLKEMPIGLWFITITYVLYAIFYYIKPFLPGGDPSIYLLMFNPTDIGFFLWFDTCLKISAVYAVTVGFYKAKKWARFLTLFYFSFSAFWALFFIFVIKVIPYKRYLLFLYCVLVISYLMMTDIKEYFLLEKN